MRLDRVISGRCSSVSWPGNVERQDYEPRTVQVRAISSWGDARHRLDVPLILDELGPLLDLKGTMEDLPRVERLLAES